MSHPLVRGLVVAAGLLGFSVVAMPSHAAILQFDLKGTGGTGLLISNENPAVASGGTGGEIGAGISFNDVTNVLTIITGWGTGNGFATNLTGNATAGHLHGPTLSGGTAAFTQNASVKYPLDSLAGWNASASAGGFNGTVSILPADVAALENGQFYMNVHTATNGGGEIRGFLTVVPEPTGLLLLAGGAIGLLRRSGRRSSH